MLIVDLDEVLCDFIGAACKVHGWTRGRLETARTPGEWGMTKPMGLTHQQFWEPINALGRDFWLNLQPLPWMNRLIELLDLTGEWWIATSPSNDIGSYVGKLLWIKLFLPDKLHTTWVTQHKYKLGKVGRYLLDDRYETIVKFQKEGGTGIIFPHQGNHCHYAADDPIPMVRQQLETVGLLK